MNTYDDNGWRTFIIGCVVLWLSFSAPTWLGSALGFEAEVNAIGIWAGKQDKLIFGACLIAQTAIGFGLVIAAYASACWALTTSLDLGRRGAELLTALVWHLLESFKLALMMVVGFYARLLSFPFRIAGKVTVALVQKYHERLADERKLQALYREEYAADFRTYSDFKRYFKAVQRGEEPAYPGSSDEAEPQPEFEEEPSPKQGPSSDPYEDALRLLGLSEPFTQAAFKAIYRVRMKEAHPDKTGSNEAAARINAAREIIKKRKGWK